MKSEIEQALNEIQTALPNKPQCWAYHLSGDALELIQGLEQLEIDGHQVRRLKAAEKFQELFPELQVSAGMISNHILKRCTCHKHREYGWPTEK